MGPECILGVCGAGNMVAKQRSGRKKKILIVDDHPILREGVKCYLTREEDLAVCGEAEDVPTGLAAVEKLKPDVVLVDISMKGRCGFDLIDIVKTRHPNLPTLVFSIHDETTYAQRAINAGAAGYVEKGVAPAIIIQAIRTVLDGRIYLGPKMSDKILGGLARRDTRNPVDVLSTRRFEIFVLISRGYKPKRIARELKISRKTVESHRAEIKKALGVRTAEELSRYAVAWGKSETEMQAREAP